jgi:hypothetical protein
MMVQQLHLPQVFSVSRSSQAERQNLRVEVTIRVHSDVSISSCAFSAVELPRTF